MSIIDFIRLVPAVMDLVKKIEEVVPVGVEGKRKLDFITDLVKAAATDVPEIAAATGSGRLTGILTLVVKLVVAFFNNVGVFSKAPATA